MNKKDRKKLCCKERARLFAALFDLNVKIGEYAEALAEAQDWFADRLKYGQTNALRERNAIRASKSRIEQLQALAKNQTARLAEIEQGEEKAALKNEIAATQEQLQQEQEKLQKHEGIYRNIQYMSVQQIMKKVIGSVSHTIQPRVIDKVGKAVTTLEKAQKSFMQCQQAYENCSGNDVVLLDRELWVVGIRQGVDKPGQPAKNIVGKANLQKTFQRSGVVKVDPPEPKMPAASTTLDNEINNWLKSYLVDAEIISDDDEFRSESLPWNIKYWQDSLFYTTKQIYLFARKLMSSDILWKQFQFYQILQRAKKTFLEDKYSLRIAEDAPNQHTQALYGSLTQFYDMMPLLPKSGLKEAVKSLGRDASSYANMQDGYVWGQYFNSIALLSYICLNPALAQRCAVHGTTTTSAILVPTLIDTAYDVSKEVVLQEKQLKDLGGLRNITAGMILELVGDKFSGAVKGAMTNVMVSGKSLGDDSITFWEKNSITIRKKTVDFIEKGEYSWDKAERSVINAAYDCLADAFFDKLSVFDSKTKKWVPGYHGKFGGLKDVDKSFMALLATKGGQKILTDLGRPENFLPKKDAEEKAHPTEATPKWSHLAIARSGIRERPQQDVYLYPLKRCSEIPPEPEIVAEPEEVLDEPLESEDEELPPEEPEKPDLNPDFIPTPPLDLPEDAGLRAPRVPEPCADIKKQLDKKRLEAKNIKVEIDKLKNELDWIKVAIRNKRLLVRIVIAKGSTFDYTRKDADRDTLPRIKRHLKKAKNYLGNYGVNLDYVFLEPVVQKVDDIHERNLNLGELRGIGAKYGSDCMPVLVFTDKVTVPGKENQLGWGMNGLADRNSNVAAVTREVFTGYNHYTIAHNLAHLLGLADKPVGKAPHHLMKRRSPGYELEKSDQKIMDEVFQQRINACKDREMDVEDELKKRENALKKVENGIENLEKQLKDCLRENQGDEKLAKERRKRCEALRYGWPELRRRYDELNNQVHLVNDELDKAKLMLEKVHELLLNMDECVRECQEKSRYGYPPQKEKNRYSSERRYDSPGMEQDYQQEVSREGPGQQEKLKGPEGETARSTPQEKATPRGQVETEKVKKLHKKEKIRLKESTEKGTTSPQKETTSGKESSWQEKTGEKLEKDGQEPQKKSPERETSGQEKTGEIVEKERGSKPSELSGPQDPKMPKKKLTLKEHTEKVVSKPGVTEKGGTEHISKTGEKAKTLQKKKLRVKQYEKSTLKVDPGKARTPAVKKKTYQDIPLLDKSLPGYSTSIFNKAWQLILGLNFGVVALVLAGLVVGGVLVGRIVWPKASKPELGMDYATEEIAAEESAVEENPDMEHSDSYYEEAIVGEYQGTEVTIIGAFTGDDAAKFNDSVAAFEEATGIDIQYEGAQDFENIVTNSVRSGDPPDIVAFPNANLLKSFAMEGDVIDVSTFLPLSSFDNYKQSWWDMAEMESPGGYITAGVWYRFNAFSLVWYPKTAFESAGYQTPNSWYEMLALSDQIVADGYKTWCAGIESGYATGWPAMHWIAEIMLRTTSLENYDKWTKGELSFNSPEVKHAFEILDELWRDENVYGTRDAIVTTYFGDAPRPMFGDPPECWLHRQGGFITTFFPEDAEFGTDYDIFYLPPIEEEHGMPLMVGGEIMAMFNDRSEVRAVMEFFTKGESVREWLADDGSLSPHKDFELNWYGNNVDRSIAELVKEADYIRIVGIDLMPGEVVLPSFKGITDYFSGTTDMDTVLAEIDASWP